MDFNQAINVMFSNPYCIQAITNLRKRDENKEFNRQQEEIFVKSLRKSLTKEKFDDILNTELRKVDIKI